MQVCHGADMSVRSVRSVRTKRVPMSEASEASVQVVQLPRWVRATEAAETLGVSERQLRRRAAAGTVERRKSGGRVEYKVAGTVEPESVRSVRPDVRTDMSGHEGSATEELRELLATEQTSRVDAERRAAVAEYRAEIAETDPEVVEELRARVAELEEHAAKATTERDEARAQGQRLADAMTRRHGLIKRLTARLGAQQ